MTPALSWRNNHMFNSKFPRFIALKVESDHVMFMGTVTLKSVDGFSHMSFWGVVVVILMVKECDFQRFAL